MWPHWLVSLYFSLPYFSQDRRAVGQQLDTVGEKLVRLGDIAEDIVSPLNARLRPSPSEDPYLRRLFDEL